MDTYFTVNKILVITTKKSLNSKSAKYHHRNEVDKNKVQQEIKLQHNILTKGIKANNQLDNKIIRKMKKDKNKVYNISEKNIVKDTNKKS